MRNWMISMKYFYREFTIYNLLFTVSGVGLLLSYSSLSYSYIFWGKVAGYAFTATIYYWYRRKYFYFFHNLGINKRTLLISSISIDALLTLLVLITIKLLIH